MDQNKDTHQVHILGSNNFIWIDIICKYGSQMVIITNKGSQLTDVSLKKFCEIQGIHFNLASMHQPQSNNQVEAEYKHVINMLKNIESAKIKWVEVLPSVL